jgi:GTP-binding protein
VGKSALFNRLVGRKLSIVHDEAGVTRDRLIAESRLGKHPFMIVDTGGIGSVVDASFSEQVHAEVGIAIETADLLLFVVDAQAGLTPVDRDLAKHLRRVKKPLILLVNKIDQENKHGALAAEFARLGFENTLSVSAEHARGITELVELIETLLPARDDGEASSDTSQVATQIAIVGRPNVGKSSLINAILRDRRTLVSEISGTTRDAVDVPYLQGNHRYVLIDTAGIRPRGKVSTSVEVFSVIRSEKSIARAHLCVLVIDATAGVTAQDKKIAGLIQKEHKPCVVAVNKWDLVEIEGDRKEFLREFMADIMSELFFVDYAPLMLLSAKTGDNMERLFRAIERVRRDARGKIGTGQLNRLLQNVLSANPPPIRGGHRFKVLYATQTEAPSSEPIPIPRFLLFVNDAEALTPAYRKYLDGRLREESRFSGLPIQLQLRGRPPRER